MGNKLLAKVIVGERIQRSAEMAHPVHPYHMFQLDLAFQCRVRQVVKADLSDWIQGTQVGISDPTRGVETNLRGE